MAKKKRLDGGPAFPRPIGHNGATHYEDREISTEQDGMSLRDWFAAQALNGLVWNRDAGNDEHGKWDESLYIANVAKKAYAMADAFLTARGEGA